MGKDVEAVKTDLPEKMPSSTMVFKSRLVAAIKAHIRFLQPAGPPPGFEFMGFEGPLSSLGLNVQVQVGHLVQKEGCRCRRR